VCPCPEDCLWLLARRLIKIYALCKTGMKILEQRFRSDLPSNLNEPGGREAAFRERYFHEVIFAINFE
jgi:hypothetical protein